MRHSIIRPLVSAIALTLALSACGDDNDVVLTPAPPPVVVAPPPPPPTPTPTSFNVQPCLDQLVAPGRPVSSLVIPDSVNLDFAQPAGFPNGRRLPDQVIDVELAVLFLDLRRHSATTFAQIPLNPGGNDQTFRSSFPFLAPPQGMPPISSGTATSFDFRTEPASAFTLVERAGFPAVSTALILGPRKIAYNESNPAEDTAFQFVPDLRAGLKSLIDALADDFVRLSLTTCATPLN